MNPSQPGEIFQPGDLVNNTYRVEKILGRGGTSEVYLTKREVGANRRYAIKVLRPEFAKDADYQALLEREEEVRDIQSDAIVRYIDIQKMSDDTVYLVMEYVEGPSLQHKLKTGGMLADDLIIVGRRVLEGLSAAHARRIYHRDLSPDNVILRDGDPAQAVIIDFGIAKDSNPDAETIVGGEFAGKFAYAAPEQMAGHSDARSDLYGLGALLLATFRGKTPDVGANPMEILKNKAKPLDLGGVPAQLAELIRRLSDPKPDSRFGSADEAIAAISAPVAAPLEDATVIAPKVAVQPKRKQKPSTAPPPRKTGRSGLAWVALLALVVGLAGVGAYLSGVGERLFVTPYPSLDPYVINVEKRADGGLAARGAMPSPETAEAFRVEVQRQNGSADLVLASGNKPDDWGMQLVRIVASLGALQTYELAAEGPVLSITGETNISDLATQLETDLEAGLTADWQSRIQIAYVPPALAVADFDAMVGGLGDCGPLHLIDPPEGGYTPEDSIVLGGRVTSEDGARRAIEGVQDIAQGRAVISELEILGEALCEIESALPTAPSVGLSFEYGYGDRPDLNPSGLYFVGENPVVDLTLPKNVRTGFLYVSVIDVSGNVFHLLPNVNRPANSVEALRGTEGDQVRLAYGLQEAEGTNKLSFLVDETVLGKSKLIVLWSRVPLFDGVRPTSESVASYAKALRDAEASGQLTVEGLDSRLIVTARAP